MTSYTVTTLTDSAPIETPPPIDDFPDFLWGAAPQFAPGLSLREAIALADANPGADTIVFEAGLTGVIHAQGTLRVNDELTINGDTNGDGIADITLSGDKSGNDQTADGFTDTRTSSASLMNDNVRIMNTDANLTLQSLNFTGGSDVSGGALTSARDTIVTVEKSTFAGNSSENGQGGAIWAGGAVAVADSLFANNIASGQAAIMAGTSIDVSGSTFYDNRAQYFGSALSAGTINISGSTFTGNAAGFGGGPIYNALRGIISDSIVLANSQDNTNGLTRSGGNIVGTNVFSGADDVGDTTAGNVFAQTATVNGLTAGALAANGGYVRTIALNASQTNPALDAASAAASLHDGRGYVRYDNPLALNGNEGGGADLGAYEIQAPPPVAEDDTITTIETSAITGNVFDANPTNPDAGAGLAVTAIDGQSASVGTQITLASGALLTLNADGTFTYDPNGKFDETPDYAASNAANRVAADSFSYTVTGGDTATVTLAIRGVDSNDRLIGTAFGDEMYGGAGNDTLIGGAGDDYLSGGAGNDTYVNPGVNTGFGEIAGGGTDTIESNRSIAALPDFIERLFLTGTLAIDGTGNALNNQFLGNDAINIIRGRDGNDFINSAGGADTIYGGSGADTLTGGLQRDKINPGVDAQRDFVTYSLMGESTGHTRDVLENMDFDNEDRIDLPTALPSSIANAVLTGRLSLATFNNDMTAAITATQMEAGQAVLFDPDSGDQNVHHMVYLIVDANGIAGYQANQDWIFQLENHTGTVDASDFF